MATTKLKENTIVRLASMEAAQDLFLKNKLPNEPKSLNDYYGIIRDSFDDVYYVEFFNHYSKTLSIASVPIDDVVEIGGLYNLIKTGIMSKESKNVVANLKPQKKTTNNVTNGKEASSDDKTLEQTNNIKQDNKASSSSLNSFRVITTGTFRYFKSKEDFISCVTSAGGSYQGNVNNKLTYLVTCTRPNQNRIKQCEDLGITIVNEYDFYCRIMKMLNDKQVSDNSVSDSAASNSSTNEE